MSLSSSQDLARRHDLDWIRVGAFFLLILYHVGMFYVPWEWHVKSPHPIPALEPVMMLTNPWRLTLLFLVSGAATRFMADKVSVGRLAGARIARLLPPLLLAMAVIVPPQSYYQVAEYVAAHPQAPFGVDPWPAFWGKYMTASGGWCGEDGDCLITPTWNHMWFVAYLLVYTLVLALLLAIVPRLGARLQAACERVLAGPWLLVLPIVFLALARATLFPIFDITHALVDDWYNHAISLAAFMLGFGLAKSSVLRERLIAMRWPAVILALAAYAAFATYAWIYRQGDPAQALRLAMRGVYAVDQWCAIAAILGFGAKHLNRGGPVLRYLTLGVFPFYIVHQTVTVVLARHLAKAGLPQGLEALILVAGTFGACFATYEIVRRIPGVRMLFGLRAQPAVEASRPPAFA
ncbi:acyltransferase family protein [Caulobacter endophyticus]|uniref:acyltransferase family protein n=1 Tax=Caulobacter endophyticus TaxID=2172652 RepID=UPI00240FDC8F|nr:acyltransferase family protein [Caulobacter endophyticus]MDG2527316.1 acyltransferase family protein [Caulobacter endophyticus]